MTAEKVKIEDEKVALTYDSLFVRHWDSWKTQRRNAVFTAKPDLIESAGGFKLSKPINILSSTELECPEPTFGGTSDFSLSATHVAFVSKDPEVNEAWHTASQVWLTTNSRDEPVRKINHTRGASSNPVFSPDGKTLAYLEMSVPGYESDKNKIMLYNLDTAETTQLASSWDRSPSNLSWNNDGSALLLIADHFGAKRLFEVQLKAHAEPQLVEAATHSTLSVVSVANGDLFLSSSSLARPMIYSVLSGQHFSNEKVIYAGTIKSLNESANSDFWFASDGRRVHALMTKPNNFDPSKKYPMIYLIHGGPQGAWNDAWSTRWNPNVMANHGDGFITVAVNFTGSTGYGQEFTDAIKGNWGSKPYEDLQNGLDYALEHFDFIDPNRCAAAGASYGGYMINWIQGHDLGRKFKALVCHDGIFNTFNVYYTTEELYFGEHDFLGVPWDDKAKACYERWNPMNHVTEWATPELVIHGSKDYRLTESEGLAVFNVLQRRGIESRLLIFKNENHFVLDHENSRLWNREVLGWIEKHTAKQ